jgi:hypothetical protein
VPGDTGHVLEADLDVLLGVDLGLALAHGHEAATEPSSPAEAPLQEHPDHQDERDGQDPRQRPTEPRVLDGAAELETVFRQPVGQFGVDAHGPESRRLAFLGIDDSARDLVAADHQIAHAPLLLVLEEAAVGDRSHLGALIPELPQQEQHPEAQDQVPEVPAPRGEVAAQPVTG